MGFEGYKINNCTTFTESIIILSICDLSNDRNIDYDCCHDRAALPKSPLGKLLIYDVSQVLTVENLLQPAPVESWCLALFTSPGQDG